MFISVYSVLKREIAQGKNVFVVQPNIDYNLTDEQLLEELDTPFTAPFGGRVERKGNLLYATVYTS